MPAGPDLPAAFARAEPEEGEPEPDLPAALVFDGLLGLLLPAEALLEPAAEVGLTSTGDLGFSVEAGAADEDDEEPGRDIRTTFLSRRGRGRLVAIAGDGPLPRMRRGTRAAGSSHGEDAAAARPGGGPTRTTDTPLTGAWSRRRA